MAKNYIIPTFQYKDAQKAIDFLVDVFGFKLKECFKDENDIIVHAQLQLGQAMIMLGQIRDNEFNKLNIQPMDIGNKCTSSPYVVVEDVKGMYDKVVDSGAIISMPFKSEDHGGESFSCHDPEGHLWNFGSYDPWA